MGGLGLDVPAYLRTPPPLSHANRRTRARLEREGPVGTLMPVVQGDMAMTKTFYQPCVCSVSTRAFGGTRVVLRSTG